MQNKKFATAINCIDGRVQQPVLEWAQQTLQVDYVDQITEPGADLVLSVGIAEKAQAILEKVSISVNAHNSRHVAVVGHYDCAGNPVDEATHKEQIRQAVEAIARWDLPVEVFGLWVNGEWAVELVCQK